MTKLGGYRLVRKLGVGSRAEVWLGNDGTNSAAIKVYRDGVSQESVGTEIEALGRISHRHVVRLDGLATGVDGVPCLIFPKLSRVSVATLCAHRAVDSGEAVTVLAPLATALAELHRCGVAHGRLRASSVLIDDDGAPVLCGFGSAILFGELPDGEHDSSLPPAKLADVTAVTADLVALNELSRAVLGDQGGEVTKWLHGESEPIAHTFALELADRLFALADPLPLCLSAGASVGRAEPVSEIVRYRADPTPDAVEHVPDEGSLGGQVRESLFGAIAAWAHADKTAWSLGRLRSRVSDVLRPVRKPVWIVAGLVALGVVAFTGLIPPGGSTGPHAQIAANGQLISAPPTPGPRPGSYRADPAITGTDPVAAGTALLHARAECFRLISILCLDGVDQAGSAAMDADSLLIRTQQSGGAVGDSGELPDPLRLSVVERLGGAVLLAAGKDDSPPVSPSVSLVLVFGDGGWRIRDLSVSSGTSP